MPVPLLKSIYFCRVEHEKWMDRCFQLAQLGESYTAPNPMVGAVIVHQNRIIGEGWHKAYGGPHAEVEAIHSVNDKALLKQSTLYVNLEPCSHYGKTPPCSLLILEHGIPRVVVAAEDPNPQVAGSGLEMLRSKGVEVITGVRQKEAIALNKNFYTYHQQNRPRITLKWAETADGFIGKERYPNVEARQISGRASSFFSHHLRATHLAILTGRKTIQTDNPQLTLRHWHGKHPLRVVLDPNHWIKKDFRILSDGHPTLIFTHHHAEITGPVEYFNIGMPFQIDKILSELYKRNIQSVMIEGGSGTLQSFLDEGYWDEAWVIRSKEKIWGNGIPAPSFQGSLKEVIDLPDDRIFHYLPL